jgi:predicted GIY-YIG superfamily endonuclease
MTSDRDLIRRAAYRRLLDIRLGIIRIPTALYRLYDRDGVLLYVGITLDFARRMRDHARVQPWWAEVKVRVVIWYESWPLAFQAETVAIAGEQPKHNRAKRPRKELPPDRQPPHRARRRRRSPNSSPPLVPLTWRT